MKQKHIPFTLYFICLALALFTILTVITAQASAANKQCTANPQAGVTEVQMGADGQALVTVPLSLVFCGPYAVSATPQQPAIVNNEQPPVQFWSVATPELYQFTLGVTGSPNTTITFQWVAVPRTQ